MIGSSPLTHVDRPGTAVQPDLAPQAARPAGRVLQGTELCSRRRGIRGSRGAGPRPQAIRPRLGSSRRRLQGGSCAALWGLADVAGVIHRPQLPGLLRAHGGDTRPAMGKDDHEHAVLRGTFSRACWLRASADVGPARRGAVRAGYPRYLKLPLQPVIARRRTGKVHPAAADRHGSQSGCGMSCVLASDRPG